MVYSINWVPLRGRQWLINGTVRFSNARTGSICLVARHVMLFARFGYSNETALLITIQAVCGKVTRGNFDRWGTLTPFSFQHYFLLQ